MGVTENFSITAVPLLPKMLAKKEAVATYWLPHYMRNSDFDLGVSGFIFR